MPPDPSRRLRARITLRQFGVLIVFVALALAVLTPIGRSAWGFWDFALLAAVELPYALLLPVLFLVRRGPIKNWIVSVLCAVPLVAFLGYANYVAMTGNIAPNLFVHPISPQILVVVAIADSFLLAGLAYLVRRVIPRRCPACGRPALLLDPSVPRSRDFSGSSRARSCLACGSRFRRTRPGPWVDVDSLPDRSASHL
jgi:hypothetical protein